MNMDPYMDIMDEQRHAAVRDLTPPPSEADITRERNALRNNGPPITMQPRSSLDEMGDETASSSGAEHIGVATVEGSQWSVSNISRYVPLSGLDFLVTADYVYIQQTIELLDLLTSVESENRYLVKSRDGETIFVAAEQSSKTERMCCGSWRGFTMRFFDPNRQEALFLRRPLAASLCCCPCFLQEIDVFAPDGKQLGRVYQEWTLFVPEFIVQDRNGSSIYRLQGPNCCGCFMYSEADFKIMSRDGLTQMGTISHSWDDFLHNYTMGITFPANVSTETKGLLIAAGFLLEYMFFEKAKTRSWTRYFRCRC
ncbi:hypothetical protein B566_EDAN017085 [Ephemera danica]|nr:hypothetical protein B566_EDAN017085 [Ephemera danica]